MNIWDFIQNSRLAEKKNYLSSTPATNIFTLDLSQGENFAIETTDTVAKSIAFSNIPATSNSILTVSLKLKFTNSAAITYPASVVWKDATIPVFVATKKYLLLFVSYDNGVTWLASSVGAWA